MADTAADDPQGPRSEYSDAIDVVFRRHALAVSSLGGDPNKAADAVQLAQATGAPAVALADNLDEAREAFRRHLGGQIIAQNPPIADWLARDPINGRLASDDLGNLSLAGNSWRRVLERPLNALSNAYAEGFGRERVGTLYAEKIGPETIARYPLLSSIGATVGVPIEGLSRITSGALSAIHSGIVSTGRALGASDQASTKFANDLTGMLEYRMLAPEVAPLAHIEPHLRAGRVPPPGFSPVTDIAHAQEAAIHSAALGDAMEAAEATALKSRAPGKFEEFLDHFGEATIRIDGQAARAHAEALRQIAPDLDFSAPEVSLPAKTFLARAPKELFAALKDDIALHDGLTPREAAEVISQPAAIPEDTVAGLRQAAGLEDLERVDRRLPTAEEVPATGVQATLTGDRSAVDRRDGGQATPTAQADLAFREAALKARADLEATEAFQAEAARVRPEVEADLTTQSDIAAHEFFSRGAIGGIVTPKPPRLERSSLTPDQAARVPARFIADTGLHPDTAGSLFGLSSDELAAALAHVESRGGREAIASAESNLRAHEALGRPPVEVVEAAKEHVLGDATLTNLATRARSEGAKASRAEMDAQASSALGATRLGALSSDRLFAVAGRAARDRARAKGAKDAPAMATAAQAQYVAAKMARGAVAVEREVRQFEALAKRFSAREVPSVEPEYTNFIHDILLRLGRPVRRSVQDLAKEIEASGNSDLRAFLDDKLSAGREIPVPEWLLDHRGPVENLTVAQAREAFAALKALAHNGREEAKIGREGAKMDRKEFLDKAVAQLASLGPATVKARGLHALGRRFLSWTLQIESLFNRFDRDDPNGIFNQHLMRPLIESANYESALEKEVAGKYRALRDDADLKATVPNTIFRDPFTAGRLPDGSLDWSHATPLPLTRKNLRAVLLHAGNADNLERLATGYGLKPQAVLDWLRQHATKADWDFAQAHGDIFAELKVLSDNMRRRMSSVPPESVDLAPIETPFGTYRGWYHPVIHDELWVGGTRAHGGLEEPGYVRAGTPQGYTKARTGYRGPLSLDLDAVPSRLRQEIHDIAFRESVVNASKVFYDARFQNAVSRHYGVEYKELLIPWLKDVANSANFRSDAQAVMSRWTEFLRQNVIATYVGLNIHTVQKHTITAAINSMTEVGAGNWLREFKNLLQKSDAQTESNWQFAMTRSEELQRRHRNYVEGIKGASDEVLKAREEGFTGRVMSFRDTMQRLGAQPVAFFDLLSAVPTWLAKYKDVLDKGGTAADAIYQGDRAVRRAHGSTAITSRPVIMRTNPWLASLYGFFNHIANRQYELAWKAKEAIGQARAGDVEAAKAHAPQLALGLFSYVIAPALVEEIVTPMMSDRHESWGVKAAKTLASGLSSSWVGVRDLVHAFLYGGDPSFGLAGGALKQVTDLANDLSKGELGFTRQHGGKTLRHAVSVFGMMTGLTNESEGRAAEFLWDLEHGHARPRDMKDWYRGLTKGTVTTKSGPDYIERLLPGRERRYGR